MATKLDSRQVVNRSALSMIGNASNEQLDVLFPRIDSELAKLFEDRNITLADGGIITFSTIGTTVSFTSSLELHINSQVAGGSPTVINLGSSAWTLSANLRMVYAVINRVAGTATVTDDSATLPAQTAANQEVILIAKRVDSGDGQVRVYFRDGTSIASGQSSRLGTVGTVFDSEFSIADATDATKKLIFDASGTSATSTTIVTSQTSNRVLTLPDITDTLVSRTNTESLSNKQVQFSVSTDSTTTGTAATLQAFTTGVVRLTSGSLLSVAGIPAGSAGQFLLLENKTGNTILISNEDTGATAANRIQTGSGGSISIPANATLAFTYDATSQRWQLTAGSGTGSGQGSKNYLSAVATSQSSTPNVGNGNFELGSTTGWSLGTIGTLVNGLPNGTPTFGSGASGNLSFSVVSSGQLAGGYSGALVSSAATTQGNMLASDTFNIDNEDQAKVLAWKFYYKAQTNPGNANWSGTSSNSFAVAFWDVTNSAWLPNTGNFGMTQSSGIGVVSGTFQTAINTTQIRMVIYNANATAGAVTVYIDDCFVGPQQIPQGAVVTDWVSFVPTGSWTSNTTYGGRWRRVGDSAEIQYSINLTGAPNATPLTINYPAGLVPDTSKIPQQSVSNPIGVANATRAASGTDLVPYFQGTSSFVLGYMLPNGSTSIVYAAVTNALPTAWANGDTFGVTIRVPIVGWSSNVQMSNDTDTRVVAAKGVGTSQVVSPSVSTLLNITAVDFDTHSAFNMSTKQYVVPVSGIYRVSAQMTTVSGSTTGVLILSCQQSGSMSNAYDLGGVQVLNAGNQYRISGSTLFNCRAGDILTVTAFKDTSSITISGSYVQFERLSGPSVVAASEAVSAIYSYASGGVMGSIGVSYFPSFNIKEIDTHGAVTQGTDMTTNGALAWRFTAPVSGTYLVSSNMRMSNTVNQNTGIGINLVKNGNTVIQESTYTSVTTGSTAGEQGTIFVGEIFLLAGEYVNVQVVQFSAASKSLVARSSSNRISISLIR